MRERGVFCNRTLNLRSIRAIGYDMDYTLVHYKVEPWERHAYEHVRARLVSQGWPLEGASFDPEFALRGLIIDHELGNLVKANRFGYVKQVLHGTRPVEFDAQRSIYGRITVDLGDPRWYFLNTLFSLSEACLYAQLVDRLDAGTLPPGTSYTQLFRLVRGTTDGIHLEGKLKAEVMADPERFVELDPDTPLALLDQLHAGKRLLLITNSEWSYTQAMMSWSFDRFLPAGTTWRDLFELIVVDAKKPSFFSGKSPIFQVVNDEGLLRPVYGELPGRGIYLGGNAQLIERTLDLSGDQILYVGDHIFGDVNMSKSLLRWRTALILRELEREVLAVEAFQKDQRTLEQLMEQKEGLERQHNLHRLAVQRLERGYGPRGELSSEEEPGHRGPPGMTREEHDRRLGALRHELTALDERIAPLAKAASSVGNPTWGPLLRTGNDKSHLARQVERYADVYTSRVSNLLELTPYAYVRSLRGSLPHDPTT